MALAPFDDVVEHLVTFSASHEVRAGNGAAARQAVRAAIERWLRADLVQASSDGRLDPVACVNAMKRAGSSALGDPLWDAYLATGRRLVLDVEASRPSAASSWRVRWRRAIPQGALAIGSSGLARVRIPLPLECAHDSLRIGPVEAPSAVVRTRPAGGALDVFLEAPPPEGLAEVAVTMTFRQGPRGLETAPASAYLCERDGLATMTESTRRLGDRLGADAVDGLWRFLFEQMTSGSLDHAALDRADPLGTVLTNGVFDCYAGAALLVTTCRARGIPARVVGGVALYPTAPFQHYWAEVLLDGEWLPFDVMSWDLAAGVLEDEAWSRRYYRRIGPRMVTERRPDAVEGPAGFRPARSWFLLMRMTSAGTEQALHDGETGALLCRDQIDVEGPLDAADPG